LNGLSFSGYYMPNSASSAEVVPFLPERFGLTATSFFVLPLHFFSLRDVYAGAPD
jgi:hypothetical protein